MTIENHYTAHELADLLSLDYETVLHKAQTGEIRSVRIGRLRRFPESAVRDYLDRLATDDVVVALHPKVAAPITKRRRH